MAVTGFLPEQERQGGAVPGPLRTDRSENGPRLGGRRASILPGAGIWVPVYVDSGQARGLARPGR